MDQDIFVSSLTHGSTFSRIDGWLAMFLKIVKATITRILRAQSVRIVKLGSSEASNLAVASRQIGSSESSN